MSYPVSSGVPQGSVMDPTFIPAVHKRPTSSVSLHKVREHCINFADNKKFIQVQFHICIQTLYRKTLLPVNIVSHVHLFEADTFVYLTELRLKGFRGIWITYRSGLFFIHPSVKSCSEFRLKLNT